jgi:hypothetical protein
VSPPLHEGHTTADRTLRTTAVAGGIVRRGVVLNAALFLRKCSSIHSVCHRTVESIWASNRFLKKNFIFIHQRGESHQGNRLQSFLMMPMPKLLHK